MIPFAEIAEGVPEAFEVVKQSRFAAQNAHAPYSSFRVGASLIFESGDIVDGCNVESASFGLTVCAERNAIFSAISEGFDMSKLLLMTVSCPDGNPEDDPHSVMPCGACRQVMSEHFGPSTAIVIDGVGRFSLDELLPQPFRLNHGRL